MSTSEFPGFEAFYDFSDPLAARPFRLEPIGESLNADEAWRLFTGQAKPTSVVELRAYRGGQVSDILWSSLTRITCISDRVVHILTSEQVTGWGTYPVVVYDRKGNQLPGYHGFSVTGPALPHVRSHSRIISKPRATLAGPGLPEDLYQGLFFEEEKWDGSDFFLVRNGETVTNRVRVLFKRHRISNALFTPLLSVEIPVHFDKYGSPSAYV